MNFEVVLDTTGSHWTADWIYNNSQYGPHTYPVNPTINGVGFASYLENGFIDNFELKSVPEPSVLVGRRWAWRRS